MKNSFFGNEMSVAIDCNGIYLHFRDEIRCSISEVQPLCTDQSRCIHSAVVISKEPFHKNDHVETHG